MQWRKICGGLDPLWWAANQAAKGEEICHIIKVDMILFLIWFLCLIVNKIWVHEIGTSLHSVFIYIFPRDYTCSYSSQWIEWTAAGSRGLTLNFYSSQWWRTSFQSSLSGLPSFRMKIPVCIQENHFIFRFSWIQWIIYKAELFVFSSTSLGQVVTMSAPK